ncbi:MAG: EthD family reductase [Gemmatimonadetes bacterium]|nr:EthD family reductase [Gemmatimonadota bacterium]
MSAGAVKVTVLFGHPADVAAFERYYLGTHIPIAQRMRGIARAELTRFRPGPDGTPPAYHRMAEFWFDSTAAMDATLASDAGRAAIADLDRFATGGVTMLAGDVTA